MPLVQYYYFRTRWQGKMRKARYVASLETIKERYDEYEIIGPAEVRHHRDPGDRELPQHFHPGTPPVWPPPPTPPLDQNVQVDPPLREGEAALARVFLRRHVTWCARMKRYAAMEGAACLYRSLRGAVRAQPRIVGTAS